ncbi:EscU/YscU/HrcU family type III secretion system export apparatus switch protein [Paenibacillus chondroitinus]|uniref:EscU/YscU/HrcU family type III secretion system export apparatus switch protein n=1 Tax=Paenibacillus chondroitinus TaxID=59842 RepID=A0ABU6DIK5_9BACL|nr:MULTISPECIES: EscU/YscU/HrcU family type III secretion system export apparatus switch protein [Paenibacillus]MCY9659013.1 EscU/YscU/HrcU family type III secretion system export apparatus switch protein [Paenibacillus anseongense]MEB4796652.1 EscU/YscU/HrcU family type III secretion system export apparatus switch protein [Paenibacillus chondroitinus]
MTKPKNPAGTPEPTPIKKAVALRYSPEAQKAPTLIAKGKGHVAEAILQKAKDNGIPVQEDSSLVEVLSKLDLDQEIPPELYQLVAEVLSFIYRSDNRMRTQRDR